eukprot:tig00000113_g5618.t1
MAATHAALLRELDALFVEAHRMVTEPGEWVPVETDAGVQAKVLTECWCRPGPPTPNLSADPPARRSASMPALNNLYPLPPLLREHPRDPGRPPSVRVGVNLEGKDASDVTRSIISLNNVARGNDFLVKEDLVEEVLPPGAGDPDGLGFAVVHDLVGFLFGWTMQWYSLFASRRLADGSALGVKIPVEPDGSSWSTRNRHRAHFPLVAIYVEGTPAGCRCVRATETSHLPWPHSIIPARTSRDLVINFNTKHVVRLARLLADGGVSLPEDPAAPSSPGLGPAPSPGAARLPPFASGSASLPPDLACSAGAGSAPQNAGPSVHALFFSLLGMTEQEAMEAENAAARLATGAAPVGDLARIGPRILEDPSLASRLQGAIEVTSQLSLRLERMNSNMMHAPPRPGPSPAAGPSPGPGPGPGQAPRPPRVPRALARVLSTSSAPAPIIKTEPMPAAFEFSEPRVLSTFSAPAPMVKAEPMPAAFEFSGPGSGAAARGREPPAGNGTAAYAWPLRGGAQQASALMPPVEIPPGGEEASSSGSPVGSGGEEWPEPGGPKPTPMLGMYIFLEEFKEKHKR